MKVDRFARKTSFPKKRRKTGFFFRGILTLGGAVCQTIGSRSTLRVPLKRWGIRDQTSYWEGLWHQNCGYTSPNTFFLEAAREISEKLNFFVKRSVPENFHRENFSGQVPTESLRTQDSENVYERWVQQIFDPVLVARSWVSATKWGPLAKL